MYPEYVGVLLSELANERSRPASAAAAYALAKRFEERRGFTMLEPTPFTDSNALAVKPATARRDGIASVRDLDRIAGGAKIGAPPEFRTRYEGLVGLKALYRLEQAKVAPLPIGSQYDALDNGTVNAAAVFTTDGQLSGDRYLILADPRRLFASQHLAPVISTKVLKAGGAPLASTVNAVSRTLTTKAMREMNAAVQLGKETPAAVATRFPRTQGLA